MPLLASTHASYAGAREGWFAFWIPGMALEWLTLLAVIATFPRRREALTSLGVVYLGSGTLWTVMVTHYLMDAAALAAVAR